MWSDAEKELLLELYPDHTTKELCEILHKSSGQVRGIKERLGLNYKLDVFSNEEIDEIEQYYRFNNGVIDLNYLSEKINRPKTSISRAAGRMGLTRRDRPLSESVKRSLHTTNERLRGTERYKDKIYPEQVALLSYYAKNEHPKGMLGKHHTDETRAQMSKSHKALWAEMSEDERNNLIANMKAGRIQHGAYHSSSNTYSRCHGGFREDLRCYFRSSWEANVARILSFLEIEWAYEPQRFVFQDSGDGVMSYCPDFHLGEIDVWIEVKGWMDVQSKTRLQKFEKEYPSEFSKLLLIDEDAYKYLVSLFSDLINELE